MLTVKYQHSIFVSPPNRERNWYSIFIDFLLLMPFSYRRLIDYQRHLFTCLFFQMRINSAFMVWLFCIEKLAKQWNVYLISFLQSIFSLLCVFFIINYKKLYLCIKRFKFLLSYVIFVLVGSHTPDAFKRLSSGLSSFVSPPNRTLSLLLRFVKAACQEGTDDYCQATSGASRVTWFKSLWLWHEFVRCRIYS